MAATLASWLAALPCAAQVPECLVVQATAEPSGGGRYDHSLSFINGCEVRMQVTARYSDSLEPVAEGVIVPAGESATIVLGFAQPTRAFRAHYDVRFGHPTRARSNREERPRRAARAAPPRPETARGTASPSETARGLLESSAPPANRLSLVELCDRAMRKLFRLQGLSETDASLRERVGNCPARVGRDPQKRRAELECVLGASTRDDVRTCFGG